MPLRPPAVASHAWGGGNYNYPPRGRRGGAIDSATERFVEETRMGATP